MKILTVAAITLAACGTPPPAQHGGALASRLEPWVPDDAVMVIALGEPSAGEAAAIDDVAVAMSVPRPGLFVAAPEILAGADGFAWIQLGDNEDEPMARCARVVDAAATAERLAAAGGERSEAGGAAIVATADATVVARDGVACVLTGGAASRRASQAVRMATLGVDERLLARAEVRDALAPVETAAVLAWGSGTVIGSGISDDLAALLGDAPRAVGVDYDTSTRELTVRIDVPDATFEPGARAAAPTALPTLPVPELGADANPDVPFSAEYQQARDAVERKMKLVADLALSIASLDTRARNGWIGEYGTAEVKDGVLRWTLPRPPAQLRGAADGVYERDMQDLLEPIAAYKAAFTAAQSAEAELVKLRAHDVAAWDKAH